VFHNLTGSVTNTMAQYQHQEQEDLSADFNLPTRKEVLNSSKKVHGKSPRKARNKKVNAKPTLLFPFLKQTKAREAAKKSTRIKESSSISEGAKIDKITKLVDDGETEKPSARAFCADVFDDFSPESFAIMFEDVKKLWVSGNEMLTNLVSLDDVLISCTVTCSIINEVVQEFVKYEEEMKYLTSAALLFYGGSWTYLAAILAAVDAFGTQQVLEESWKIVILFLSDDSEEDQVSPADIKDTLKDLGLHIALLFAINVSPFCAEICITVAFASKFSSLIPVKNMLKNTMMMPGVEISEFEEYFSEVDNSWFDLLAVIASNILSLTLFGCFPRLVTAMYMGYIGASIAVDSLMNRVRESELCNVEVFDKIFGMNKTVQYWIWGVVAAMSVWQALSDYTGYCVLFSWLMFLQPVVRVYNMVAADCDEMNDL